MVVNALHTNEVSHQDALGIGQNAQVLHMGSGFKQSTNASDGRGGGECRPRKRCTKGTVLWCAFKGCTVSGVTRSIYDHLGA